MLTRPLMPSVAETRLVATDRYAIHEAPAVPTVSSTKVCITSIGQDWPGGREGGGEGEGWGRNGVIRGKGQLTNLKPRKPERESLAWPA